LFGVCVNIFITIGKFTSETNFDKFLLD
jgi:hypothetical protein